MEINQAAFKLSRIYAEGWNMARKIFASGKNPADFDRTRLNPYAGDPEQARWNDGFTGAAAESKTR